MLENIDGVMEDLKLCHGDKYLEFGIFLTDTSQQIMPVTSGTRVALQYDVH
jgi:hypothetical protein